MRSSCTSSSPCLVPLEARWQVGVVFGPPVPSINKPGTGEPCRPSPLAQFRATHDLGCWQATLARIVALGSFSEKHKVEREFLFSTLRVPPCRLYTGSISVQRESFWFRRLWPQFVPCLTEFLLLWGSIKCFFSGYFLPDRGVVITNTSRSSLLVAEC